MFMVDDYDPFVLAHYGTKYHSGRYPYGSGDNPYQHDPKRFLDRIRQLKESGLNEKEIAEYFGLATDKGSGTRQLRILKGIATDEMRASLINEAERLVYQEGLSKSEAARRMGLPNESSVRSLLDERAKARTTAVSNVVDFLKQQVDEKGMIDVGAGVEHDLNISRKKLDEALYILERDGYITYGGSVQQITNVNQKTNQKILTPPGTEHKDIYQQDQIHTINDYMFDNNDPQALPKKAFQYPESMDSSRLMIRYAEDGGKEKDGVIELRKGVDDLSLGTSSYAQVRIMVDNDRYLKGMAVYSDNMPDGVDVIFNTNKTKDVDMRDVLKKIKTDDPDNPFGSLLKEHGGQSYYEDENGEKHLSLINKTREEGDWDSWKDKLPSQFLAKQSKQLIDRQLNLELANRQAEFDEIMALTQPTLKRKLLKEFSDDCDAAAVDLQAAALPGQKYKVILPVTSLKDNEVYAPTYENGTEIALVRFPHGGTFEIPILTVNNKNRDAKDMLGNAIDAVGINSKNAETLSGADFDGDTVMVIPITSTTKIASREPLAGLAGFDAKLEYAKVPGMKIMGKEQTQIEMGKISNLITDMTLKGATDEELAAAVRHSMVVIDANKHELNYTASYKDNNIATLTEKYKGHYTEDGKYTTGASTLISRAKHEVDIPKTVGTPKIDPDTGEYIYKEDPNRFYVNKQGKTVERTQKATEMSIVKDANLLSSGTPKEKAYADYANSLKTMANTARKEMVNTKDVERSSSAAKTYKPEVDSLLNKLRVSEQNAPKERAAQRMAQSTVQAQIDANPDLKKDKKTLGKLRTSAITNARLAVGAKSTKIDITDREWEAIQAQAVSKSSLIKIFNHTDPDEVRKRATPRSTTSLNTAKINLIKSYNRSGYSISEIADELGVSTSTVSKYIKE